MKHFKDHLRTFMLIALGSAVYALATQFFIFSNNLFLGGTSGVSVILNHFFPAFSSGDFLMLINIVLMVLALIILGRNMAVKTFIGSTLTTLFIGFIDHVFPLSEIPVVHPVLSAVIGASLIAVASAILFYIDSSSGGTDIIALIIRKFSSIQIGKALLVSDVLIVIIGACVSSLPIAIASVIGLVIKTFGIDVVIGAFNRIKSKNRP